MSKVTNVDSVDMSEYQSIGRSLRGKYAPEICNKRQVCEITGKWIEVGDKAYYRRRVLVVRPDTFRTEDIGHTFISEEGYVWEILKDG